MIQQLTESLMEHIEKKIDLPKATYVPKNEICMVVYGDVLKEAVRLFVRETDDGYLASYVLTDFRDPNLNIELGFSDNTPDQLVDQILDYINKFRKDIQISDDRFYTPTLI